MYTYNVANITIDIVSEIQVDATVDVICAAGMIMQRLRPRAGVWSWLPNVSFERNIVIAVNPTLGDTKFFNSRHQLSFYTGCRE